MQYRPDANRGAWRWFAAKLFDPVKTTYKEVPFSVNPGYSLILMLILSRIVMLPYYFVLNIQAINEFMSMCVIDHPNIIRAHGILDAPKVLAQLVHAPENGFVRDSASIYKCDFALICFLKNMCNNR